MNNKAVCLVITCLVSFSTFANEGDKIVKFQSEEVKLKIGGRLQIDHDNFDGVHNNGNSGSMTEIRRARIYVKSEIGKNWATKLNVEVSDKTKEVKVWDAYLKYKGAKWGDITIGKVKEPFGLEVLNSNKYISMIERSMPSIAFAPFRGNGIMVFGQGSDTSYAAGVYVADQETEKKETYAWTGRVTYAPRLSKNAFIHLGLSGSYRDTADYQINQYAEVHTAEKIMTSGLIDQVDHVTLLGLEAAVVFGSFSLQTEYMMSAIDANSGDAEYDGYYIQADYILTGESRSYKNTHFGAIKPRTARGAWQLVARLSHLDADDNNVGVEADNITLGLNYYANSRVRLSTNYLMTKLSGSDADANENDGNALSFRFQYIF